MEHCGSTDEVEAAAERLFIGDVQPNNESGSIQAARACLSQSQRQASQAERWKTTDASGQSVTMASERLAKSQSKTGTGEKNQSPNRVETPIDPGSDTINVTKKENATKRIEKMNAVGNRNVNRNGKRKERKPNGSSRRSFSKNRNVRLRRKKSLNGNDRRLSS